MERLEVIVDVRLRVLGLGEPPRITTRIARRVGRVCFLDYEGVKLCLT